MLIKFILISHRKTVPKSNAFKKSSLPYLCNCRTKKCAVVFVSFVGWRLTLSACFKECLCFINPNHNCHLFFNLFFFFLMSIIFSFFFFLIFHLRTHIHYLSLLFCFRISLSLCDDFHSYLYTKPAHGKAAAASSPLLTDCSYHLLFSSWTRLHSARFAKWMQSLGFKVTCTMYIYIGKRPCRCINLCT